MIKIPFFFT